VYSELPVFQSQIFSHNYRNECPQSWDTLTLYEIHNSDSFLSIEHFCFFGKFQNLPVLQKGTNSRGFRLWCVKCITPYICLGCRRTGSRWIQTTGGILHLSAAAGNEIFSKENCLPLSPSKYPISPTFLPIQLFHNFVFNS
jgi:hypothetical protein